MDKLMRLPKISQNPRQKRIRNVTGIGEISQVDDRLFPMADAHAMIAFFCRQLFENLAMNIAAIFGGMLLY
jgi:hypothetical protein